MSEVGKEVINRLQALLDNETFNNPYYSSKYDEKHDIEIKIEQIKKWESKQKKFFM